MNNIKTFNEFHQLNEGISFGYYVFTSRTAFSAFDDALPEKGESVFCVFLHNQVEINGETVYLGGSSGLQYEILGLYADEADAKKVYDEAVKAKKPGNKLSVTMGTLLSKSKFQFSYDETAGYRAKGIVK